VQLSTLESTPTFIIKRVDNAMWTVGQVANLAQVTTDTLRFYERQGLLAPNAKSAAGYRLYDTDAISQRRNKENE
jgi:hypothetical protein